MRYWNDNRKSCKHVEPREDWKESIEKWIDWMDAIGRTNETLRTRWYQIVRFSKAVDKSITDVTEDDLIFYLAGMGTEGRRGVRSCVKVFYQWSMKRGIARCNPADEVPTVPMTLPSGCICPEENIEQGLASPDEDARLAVMLGAFCGLRRIEMTRINLKTDLEENAEGMMLHVHGKGNKERILPVPARLSATLRKRTGVWLFPGDVQLATDDGWINPYHDRINAQRSCRRMEKTRPELVELARSDTGTRVSWQYGQWRRWAEWKARTDYGDDAGWDALEGDERGRLVAAVAASTMPRQHVGRIVEACARASRSEDEFIRRIRREGFSIDPRLCREPPKPRSPTPARWSATGSHGIARTGGRNGSTPSSSAMTCD